MNVEAVKREGWCSHGILVVSFDDQRLTWMEKQVVGIIGKRFYGGK